MKFLQNVTFPNFVKPVETVFCKGKEHLKEYFEKIIKKGGEGVMLRKPKSLYEGGRSESLCKYKVCVLNPYVIQLEKGIL
jgi:DNA ligase-1